MPELGLGTPNARDWDWAQKKGILRAKEEMDVNHLLVGLLDGCVCGLCAAARQAVEKRLQPYTNNSQKSVLHGS